MSLNIHSETLFKTAYGDRDWAFYKQLLGSCVTHGKPGTWLDLGAGLGLLTECAFRFGIDCIGLEGSEYAVHEARNRVPGLDVRLHDLGKPFPLGENSIATVVLNQTIEHLDKPAAQFVLRESYRVLEPGGVLLIYSPCWYNRQERKEITHINLYSPKTLAAEVKQACFKIVAEPNSPNFLLGKSSVGRAVVGLLFRLFPADFLSASSNCIAQKAL